MPTIAVLITCYNRREKTIECIRSVFHSLAGTEYACRIYLTDDGCTDGTYEAVSGLFPEVVIARTEGNLFWSGGMRIAFGKAMADGFDYYLWLNDDTTLLNSSIADLILTHTEVSKKLNKKSIIVGSTEDGRGNTTYGGMRRESIFRPLRFSLVSNPNHIAECATMNGNCVLIPAVVAMELGNLDFHYVHGIGDFDYGLRATKSGIGIYVKPGFVGQCINDHGSSHPYLDKNCSVVTRLKRVLSPKYFPIHAWGHFCRSHAGVLWPIYFASPYFRAIFALKN